MEEEIWKTIPISKKYEASTFGRIRRIKKRNMLKPYKHEDGYLTVGIKGTLGENITRFVHRLVAITFIPNPDNEPTVNHINHDRSNNNVNNLEWASHKNQNNHSRKRKLTIEEYPSSSEGDRNIWKCDKFTGERIEMFKSIREAYCKTESSFRGVFSQIFYVAENHEISNSLPDSREGMLVAAGFKWKYDELRKFKTEEWCSIDPLHVKGAEGYEISTLGRSCDPKGIVRSPVRYGKYPMISIKGVQFLAHRLVALTFLQRIEGKDFVNHIDGNKCNPIVDNLELCSQSENIQHAYDNGLIIREIKKVCQYDLKGNFIKEFNSVKEATDELGIVGDNNISCAILREGSAGGFIWRRQSGDKSKIVVKQRKKRKTKKVWQCDLKGNFIKEFNSVNEAKDELCNVSGNIQSAITKRGSACGFTWRRPPAKA